MRSQRPDISLLLVREVGKAVIINAGVLYARVAVFREDVEDAVLTAEGRGKVLVTMIILLQPALHILYI